MNVLENFFIIYLLTRKSLPFVIASETVEKFYSIFWFSFRLLLFQLIINKYIEIHAREIDSMGM